MGTSLRVGLSVLAKRSTRRTGAMAAALVACLLEAAPAFGAPSLEASDGLRLAYIDPGAGSFMIQALVAAAAGVAVTAKLYWSRIKKLFGGPREREGEDDPPGGGA